MRFLISLFLLFPVAASSVTLKYVGETSVSHKTKFRNTKIGGLSGLSYHGGKLWALSDDKGRDGDPRFYIFNLKIDGHKVELKPEEVFSLTGLPSPKGEVPYLDAESIVRLPSGDLLISSENNNDRKPRAMPRIFRVDAEGVFKGDLVLPDIFLPEPLGLQKKGLQNNAGFEGLSLAPDGKTLYALTEAPILTDLPEGLAENQDQWLRLVKFEVDSKSGDFVAKSQQAYKLEALTKTSGGQEVFRGASEILVLDDKKILVLERGVRLQKSGWNQSVALYEIDLQTGSDVSAVKNLSSAAKDPVTKTKVLDFEVDLQKVRPKKSTQNYEGLALGPVIGGKKTVLVISDDNFSSKEKTELLVFKVESE